MREEEIKQLEIDKIHWRDLYWEECEKNKRLKEEGIENSKLYWDLMKEKEEYVEKRKMSNWKNNLNIGKIKKLEEENKKLKEQIELDYKISKGEVVCLGGFGM